MSTADATQPAVTETVALEDRLAQQRTTIAELARELVTLEDADEVSQAALLRASNLRRELRANARAYRDTFAERHRLRAELGY